MKVIVMCENLAQFYNYAEAVISNEDILPARRTVINRSRTITKHIEDIEFIYCNCPYILKGRSFSKNDYLVRVGSWYNIPIEIREAIEAEFRVRVRICEH